MRRPIGRLAPSPTGAQHLGNARTYLLAWLSIRSGNGRLILRIEDIDSPRIKPGADLQVMEDLNWLGLDVDEGPATPGSLGPYRQTDRLPHYREALTRLIAAEKVYPCTCSRQDVLDAASAPHIGQEGPVYPGTCAGRRAADAATLSNRPFCWRFRMTEQPLQYDDIVRGCERSRAPHGTGDFVVWKADDTPAYQLAVVVDDAAMGVTEVVRGDDLVPSTFRQLALGRELGIDPPRFGHVPLVVGPDGRRLAKRHGDTRLATLRAEGVAADAIVGLLAWSCGLTRDPTPCKPADLLAGFALSRIAGPPFVLQPEHLAQIGWRR